MILCCFYVNVNFLQHYNIKNRQNCNEQLKKIFCFKSANILHFRVLDQQRKIHCRYKFLGTTKLGYVYRNMRKW